MRDTGGGGGGMGDEPYPTCQTSHQASPWSTHTTFDICHQLKASLPAPSSRHHRGGGGGVGGWGGGGGRALPDHPIQPHDNYAWHKDPNYHPAAESLLIRKAPCRVEGKGRGNTGLCLL